MSVSKRLLFMISLWYLFLSTLIAWMSSDLSNYILAFFWYVVAIFLFLKAWFKKEDP